MTQPQREALLDLLNLAILSDSHISLKESDSLQAAVDGLGWDSPRPRDIHMLTSISHAHRATESLEATHNFVSIKSAVFADANSQQEALAALKTVLASDGLSSEEATFLTQLSGAFHRA